jgi:hypothetical protein
MGTSANRAASFPYYRSRNFFTLEGLTYPLNPNLIKLPPFSLDPPYDSFDVFDPQLKLPRTWQWSAALEQAIGTGQTFSATYVGAIGRRLLRREVLRELNADFFAPLFATRNAAASDYHALQLQFQRRCAGSAFGKLTWQCAGNSP